MSLRPIISMSRPGSAVRTFELVDTAVQSVPRSLYSHDSPNGWILTDTEIGLPASSVNLQTSPRPTSGRASSQNPVGFHLELHGGNQTITSSSHQVHNAGDPSFFIELGNAETEEVVNQPRRSHSGRLPNIVRGSILIKNAIDTTNPPPLIDVIETDDDSVTVTEDNSNMFHGKYMMRKENPLYASDPELNKSEDEDEYDDAEIPSSGSGNRPRPVRDATDGMVGRLAQKTRRKTSDSESEVLSVSAFTSVNRYTNLDDDSFDREVPMNNERQRRTQTSTDDMRIDQWNGFRSSVAAGQRGDASEGSRRTGAYTETRRTEIQTTEALAGEEEEHQHDQYRDDEFDTEVKVNRDYRPGQTERFTSAFKNREMTTRSARPSRSQSESMALFSGGDADSLNMKTISTLNIRSLMVSVPNSVKQTISVDRIEDEILSGLPNKDENQQKTSDYASPLDFDKVSEQVDLDLVDGKVILTSRARSERIVPIMGADNLYKKSAVVVTKRIEMDMTLTPQRRRLYEMITERQTKYGPNTSKDGSGKLDKLETFELYKKFAALADLDRALAN